MRAALVALFVATPVAANPPQLALPIDCELGTDCYIQNYVDNDPTTGVADFACGRQSYDGHKGTDFALIDLAQMRAGVAVLAAADGRITGTRQHLIDRIVDPKNPHDLNGLDCGNGVAIDYGDGWRGQYCHLAQGSITVKAGDFVRQGDVLGNVGLSGNTSFPHVHVSLRHGDQVVDPFAPDATQSCGPQPDLWDNSVTYTPGGIISASITTQIPEFTDALNDDTQRVVLPAKAPNMILWTIAHGVRAGDEIRMQITGPDGTLFTHQETLEKTQARIFRYRGKKQRGVAHGWPAGDYTGRVTLSRDGEIIDAFQIETRVDG